MSIKYKLCPTFHPKMPGIARINVYSPKGNTDYGSLDPDILLAVLYQHAELMDWLAEHPQFDDLVSFALVQQATKNRLMTAAA